MMLTPTGPPPEPTAADQFRLHTQRALQAIAVLHEALEAREDAAGRLATRPTPVLILTWRMQHTIQSLRNRLQQDLEAADA